MSRIWFFCHLPGADPRAAEGVSESYAAIPALVDEVRRKDPGARWFFHRPADGDRWGGGLWFHAEEAALEAVSGAVPEAAPVRSGDAAGPVGAGLHRESGERPEPPRPAFDGVHLDDELAFRSGELALETLRHGPLDEERQLGFAVLHLGRLVELLPESERPAFLFLYWQERVGRLSREERLRAAERADVHGAALAAAATPEGFGNFRSGELAGTALRNYLDAARSAVEAPARPDAPANYLLFGHARHTHERMGIPASTDALAARALRTALRISPVTARELQPV
ncbi:hypothetical protein AB0E96_15400 [Kitasatospora sp. NPDC036755]|uniref:hypothetical protein n=1 Tax=Kitasatospora sp. NPDC036755 TaxID=3154600 RepID=UPI0033E23DB4